MMNISLFNRALFGAATLAMLVLGACNTDGDSACDKPEMSLQTPANGLEYFITNTDDHGFYELQYGASGFGLGSGTVVTVNSHGTISNMNNGTYDIYLRGNCGGDSWSDWNGPQSFLITGGSSSTCGVPYSFMSYSYTHSATIQWQHTAGAADYFQVQYGLTGFTFGTGTTISVPQSNTTLANLSSGTVYDYYVRANCGGTDFSAWSNVNSFVTD